MPVLYKEPASRVVDAKNLRTSGRDLGLNLTLDLDVNLDFEIELIDRYDSEVEHQGRSTVAFDNVACALALLEYNALVVGPEDFMYGPERLRQLARLLYGSPGRLRKSSPSVMRRRISGGAQSR